jgi:hypothetical protein
MLDPSTTPVLIPSPYLRPTRAGVHSCHQTITTPTERTGSHRRATGPLYQTPLGVIFALHQPGCCARNLQTSPSSSLQSCQLSSFCCFRRNDRAISGPGREIPPPTTVVATAPSAFARRPDCPKFSPPNRPRMSPASKLSSAPTLSTTFTLNVGTRKSPEAEDLSAPLQQYRYLGRMPLERIRKPPIGV